MITYRQFLNEDFSGMTKEQVLAAFSEDVFIEAEKDAQDVFDYAINIVKSPWPEFIEKFTNYFIKVSEDTKTYLMVDYPIFESVMGCDSLSKFFTDYLPPYYEKVLNRQRQYLLELEKFMLGFDDPYMLLEYCERVLKQRWHEVELILVKDGEVWRKYLSRVCGKITDITRKGWIKIFPVPLDLINTLNIVGWGDSPQTKYQMQEYIIKNHPSLIKEIKGLDPRLEQKHGYEIKLAGIDV